MSNFDKVLSKLKGLKQYRGLSDEQLKVLAKEKLEKDQILKNLTFCISDKEREYAAELLEQYLAESSIESIADKDTLKQLIDIEVLIERIKQFLNVEYQKANSAIPLKMTEELRASNELALELKEKLGLTNKDREQATWLETWEELKKKAKKYYEEHKGCNVVKCPYCQNMFMLLMRTENLDAQKCTMFKDTILYNKKLLDLYHEKRLTKEELAEILGVSIKYIDEIYDNLYLKELEQK